MMERDLPFTPYLRRARQNLIRSKYWATPEGDGPSTATFGEAGALETVERVGNLKLPLLIIDERP
jgi:hypothetical protein